MINLLDIKLSHLLPTNYVDEKLKALDSVISFSLQLLQKYLDNVNFTVNMDNLPENIIDYLACEYRTPYYDEALDLQTKRNLVKATMLTYQKIGTTNIIKEYLGTLKEDADIAEWYDYGGNPYNFKIFLNVSDNKEIDENLLNDIKNRIELLNSSVYVKNIHCSVASGFQTESNIGNATINDDFSNMTFLADDDCILIDDDGSVFYYEEGN